MPSAPNDPSDVELGFLDVDAGADGDEGFQFAGVGHDLPAVRRAYAPETTCSSPRMPALIAEDRRSLAPRISSSAVL